MSLTTEQISSKLIVYLRDELKNPAIEYASNLKQLQGGYETAIYRFKLKSVGDEYSQFLILRLYPQFYGIQNAIWESTVQNALADAGYPVANTYFLCTDMNILGGAFYIMDHIPGQPLMFAPQETVPGIMGKTHAELHNMDPEPLVKTLKERGISEEGLSLARRIDWMNTKASELPWIREGLHWLLENQPPEPEGLSICHGDFHALNIMVDHGTVTGVLDWGGFAIADPVFDVANTIVLTTIPAKHLSFSWEGFSQVDWDLAAALYLSEYQIHKELDHTNLDYYIVRRCLMSLIQGFEGQKVWQHPMIVRDLVGKIQKITSLVIRLPG